MNNTIRVNNGENIRRNRAVKTKSRKRGLFTKSQLRDIIAFVKLINFSSIGLLCAFTVKEVGVLMSTQPENKTVFLVIAAILGIVATSSFAKVLRLTECRD